MGELDEKDWRQEKKGRTEDKMVGWHHRLDGHKFEQAPEVGDDREAWCAAVYGFAKSWTRLSNWTGYHVSKSLIFPYIVLSPW